MAILRVKEIREMSSEQRIEKVNEFRTELARIKTMVAAGGAIDNPSQIREMRKNYCSYLNHRRRRTEW